ncbi:MAG: hypothetical protein ACR2GW_12635 [Pyrinomonadaceae bacterium]
MLKLLCVRLSLLLLLPLFCATASAQDMSIFGMRLGEPLTILECARDKHGYRISSDSGCYKRTSIYGYLNDKKYDKKNPPPPLGTEHVEIHFPFSERPQIVSSVGVMALVIDSKLEGIGFNTLGITDDDSVLEKLKEKYGTPTAFIPNKVQNRMGASFEAFVASWVFPDLYVTFQSVTNKLDSGLVNIDTKKGKEHREQALKELQKDRRPL